MSWKKLNKIIDVAVDMNREYQDAKEDAVQDSIMKLEARTNPLVFAVLVFLTIGVWYVALFGGVDLAILVDQFGLNGVFYPLIAVLAISYFTFYLGSKFVFRPSTKTVPDDDVMFTPMRSYSIEDIRRLISIALSVIHTSIVFIVIAS